MKITHSFRAYSVIRYPKNEGGKSTKKYLLYVDADTGVTTEVKPDELSNIEIVDITRSVLAERIAKARNKIKEEGYNGQLGKSAKTTISKAVSLWFAAMELEAETLKNLKRKVIYYPTFVTLTLSSKQDESDQSIKRKLLNHFLIMAKRKWEIKHYVWRVEPQGNGNIHIHILLDRFIAWQQIRSSWNEIQDKSGYVAEFIKVHNKSNPNSTDVHKLKSIRNPAAYICKYMTKMEELKNGETRRKIEGRIWGMSDSLRKLEYYEGDCSEDSKVNSVAFKNELEYIKRNWLDVNYWNNARVINEYVSIASFDEKIQHIAQGYNLLNFAKSYLLHLRSIYQMLY